MKWIFLSPHLDDIAFSCGGLVWDLADKGSQVEIWTICAGDPGQEDLSLLAQGLHASWGLGLDAVQKRRDEDREACRVLGAKGRYFDYLDCIYRKSAAGEFLYGAPGDIFGGLDPEEAGLIVTLTRILEEQIPEGSRLVSPLGIGNHVDHEWVRKAANRIESELLFYADYPYAREKEGSEILEFMRGSEEWQAEDYPVSPQGLDKWVLAAGLYRSQISTFWQDRDALQSEILEFSAKMDGIRLWKAVEDH